MRQLFAIIGHPVSHSLSPVFQQAAFDSLGIDAAYLPFDIAPAALEAGLFALRTLGASGFNITLPHKESLFPHLSRISPEASVIGAVNTVTIDDGTWEGHNTDGPGFQMAATRFFERNALTCPDHALVFGAGGSARATLWALRKMGIRHLCLVNRSLERAQKIAVSMEPDLTGCLQIYAIDDPAWNVWLRKASRPVIVNTLSIGAFPEHFAPLDAIDLTGIGAMLDLSYPPLPVSGKPSADSSGGETAFLKAGRRFQIPRQNGIGMLLCQGALSFSLWTGRAAPFDQMASALYRKSGREDFWLSF